jgi:GPH family glycoside/pentoside/hexuronide:cation symporter
LSEIKKNFEGIPEIKYSRKHMASYGAGKALVEFFNMAFGSYAFYYYEGEIGLNVWLTGLGFIIFAVWNAINDPLMGYLTNHPFRFTKKWGRRFPWILIGGLPYVLSYILIFTPPSTNPQTGAWIIFIWLVFTTCMFDTFASVFWVNFSGLFPDKFRSLEERRKATGIQTAVGIIGIALGSLIPPNIVKFNVLQSYVVQGGVVVLIALVFLVLALPGSREDPAMIDIYLAKYEEQLKQESFIKTLKTAFKQKNFVAFIISYFLYQTVTISMTASLPYFVRYVLEEEASVQMIVSAGLLIGVLISLPLWVKLAHKLNDNRKILLIAGIGMTIFTIPIIFIEDLISSLIAIIVWGIGFGGYWAMLWAVLGDVIDESVANTHKREEGVYTGIQAFFGRLSYAGQAFSFAIVHTLTGYVNLAPSQEPLAVWGIHVHIGLIPMILMMLSVFIFWKWYKLTPDKVKVIKEKLIEIGL